MQNIYKKFMNAVYDAQERAYQKLIKDIMKELTVSEKCAKKYINKYLYVNIEIEQSYNMEEVPKIHLVAKPKSIETILQEKNEIGWECEKQLLKGYVEEIK